MTSLLAVYRAVFGDEPAQKPAQAKGNQVFSADDVNTRVDDATSAGRAEGLSTGLQEGAAMERARIAAILSCPEVNGRDQLARQLAFNSDVAAEDAVKILSSAPKDDPRETNLFFKAMARVANPDVGSDEYTADMSDDQRADALASSIVQAYQKFQKNTA